MGNAFSQANLGNPSVKRATQERRSWQHRRAFEEGLAQPGCVVCNQLARCERKAINGFLYECIIDPAVRRRFLDAGGFCREHFAAACDIEKEFWPDGGIVMAILCEDLLHRAIWISGKGASGEVGSPMDQRRRDVCGTSTMGEYCTFCMEQRESESSFLAALEELLDFESVAAEFTPARLCLVHAQAASASWRDEAKRARAWQLVRHHAQELLADLEDGMRQHDDHHFPGKPPCTERNAVLRSMRFLVGGKESK